ncbi:MAG: cardiolipin synthase [Lachnospiraceae bacterium]|nr:cardiolipin synthase [Lachnospiraceae bacterium]
MRKIGNALFRRAVLIPLFIVLQFSWLALVLYQFSLQYTFINILFIIAAVILAVIIYDKDRYAEGKMSWIFLILVVPIIGVSLYFIFGRSTLTKKTEEKLERVNEEIDPFLTEDEQVEKAIAKENKRIYNQVRYIRDWAGYPIYQSTQTQYYTSGEAMFPVMLDAIRSATSFIFLEFFIFDSGIMLDQLLEVLDEKVAQGVEIRMIYDDVGCSNTLPANYWQKMEERGIQCTAFNPFRPIMSIIMNNRDHRKILVVDGRIAFTGGINIADEYINAISRFGYWKDTGVKIEGKAVWSFTAMFLKMWNFAKETTENYLAYKPDLNWKKSYDSDGYVQPYADSPIDHENQAENIYLNIINYAKDYVYIFTPYLIIDEEMCVSLCNAAKSGVDVRIVLPGIPDKKMVFLLTQSYYKKLLKAGIKIYQYAKGFVHAKCFVCDDEIATVGSINLDYRSLYLHYECGIFMYQSKAVMQVKSDILETIQQSKRISFEFCENREWYVKVLQCLLRLFAPLL